MTSWVSPDVGTIGLQVGCQFDLRSSNPTTAVLQVAPHGDQTASITAEWWDVAIPHRPYLDEFANRCERFELPAGEVRLAYSAEVSVSAVADEQAWDARETPVDELADDLLRWVMPSRFCQPDELGSDAWHMFGSVTPGWARVQAICDFVNAHLAYVHGSSNPWTTAADAVPVGTGRVPRLRAPGDHVLPSAQHPRPLRVRLHPRHRQPPPYELMDFAAWFEVYLSGRWHTFDARLNQPRIGRVLVARGRDAVDVAQMTSFGAVDLLGFAVKADRLV